MTESLCGAREVGKIRIPNKASNQEGEYRGGELGPELLTGKPEVVEDAFHLAKLGVRLAH